MNQNMIDHFNLPVSDLKTSLNFYNPVLQTLGLSVLIQEVDVVGFGGEFWAFGIVKEEIPFPQLHVAFRADSPAAVQAFYRAALDAGGRDNGLPGLRPEYGPSYYSAFVYDPDGHNVESVCRG